MERSRVVVVGLDGATWEVLDHLMAEGVMPNLATLVGGGVRAPLASTYPGWTPPGWTSIATGLNPGHHGILYANTVIQGEYPGAVPGGVAGHPISALDVHGAPIWRVLSAAGRRVCVLLVPLTYPPEPVNGILVSGMFRPRESTDYVHPPETTPPERWRYDPEEILRGGDAGRDDPGRIAGGVRRIAEENARVFAEHLRREPWDLFFAVFMAPDRLSHYFWERMIALRPGEGDEVDTEIERTWRAIDGFIGDALAETGRGAAVALVSDHGSGSAALHLLNVVRVLQEAGLLRTVRRGWRRRPVAPLSLDWPRTSAFPIAMGDFHMVGVAVNERGRWPAGSVDPAEAPSVLERAERALRALRDSQGRPVVAEIHRAADVYRGPFAVRFPDLVVELDPAFMAGGGPDEPLVAPRHDRGAAWGSHRQQGILALSGPGIRPATLQAMPRVEDVAPTLMRLQGLAFAHQVDGRVLEEVLEAAPVLPAPAVPEARPQTGAPPIEAEEEAEIEGMLRGLGYVE